MATFNEEEMVRMFRQAKSKREIIQVMMDTNCMSREEVCRTLVDNGVSWRELPRKTHRKNTAHPAEEVEETEQAEPEEPEAQEEPEERENQATPICVGDVLALIANYKAELAKLEQEAADIRYALQKIRDELVDVV